MFYGYATRAFKKSMRSRKTVSLRFKILKLTKEWKRSAKSLYIPYFNNFKFEFLGLGSKRAEFRVEE